MKNFLIFLTIFFVQCDIAATKQGAIDVELTPLRRIPRMQSLKELNDEIQARTHACSLGQRESWLLQAAHMGRAMSAAGLLFLGANPNCRDHAGQTPLEHAMTGHHIAVIRALLAHGARYDYTLPSSQTLLHYAITLNDADIVDALLDFDSDVMARDRTGWRPYDMLAMRNRLAKKRAQCAQYQLFGKSCGVKDQSEHRRRLARLRGTLEAVPEDETAFF